MTEGATASHWISVSLSRINNVFCSHGYTNPPTIYPEGYSLELEAEKRKNDQGKVKNIEEYYKIINKLRNEEYCGTIHLYNYSDISEFSKNKSNINEEELFDFIVENDSEDYEINDDEYNIYCDQKILHQLNQKIIEKFGQTNFTGLIWKSENEITVSKDKADTLFKLLNILEENEDVQAVSSNFDVSDEVLASLTA